MSNSELIAEFQDALNQSYRTVRFYQRRIQKNIRDLATEVDQETRENLEKDIECCRRQKAVAELCIETFNKSITELMV
jgi:hypothetical protein